MGTCFAVLFLPPPGLCQAHFDGLLQGFKFARRYQLDSLRSHTVVRCDYGHAQVECFSDSNRVTVILCCSQEHVTLGDRTKSGPMRHRAAHKDVICIGLGPHPSQQLSLQASRANDQ